MAATFVPSLWPSRKIFDGSTFGERAPKRITDAASFWMRPYGFFGFNWAGSVLSTGPMPVTPRLLKRSVA